MATNGRDDEGGTSPKSGDTVVSIQDLRRELDGGRSGHKDYAKSLVHDLVEIRETLGSKPKSTMFRVPLPVYNVKPENFTPAEISLGLFNRKLAHGEPTTQGDQLRLKLACKFLEIVGKGNSIEHEWTNVCNRVVPDPRETQDLYDEFGRERMSLEEVQGVLTLDAIFVTFFLAAFTHPRLDDELQGLLALIRNNTTARTHDSIMFDLSMVQNQIPLKLIQNVVDITFDKHATRPFMRRICFAFKLHLEKNLPGCPDDDSKERNPDYRNSFDFFGCSNLLDVGYCWLVHNLPDATEELNLSESIPSITRLQKAGITFKGEKGGFHHTRFRQGRLHATLCLPIMRMHDKSELIWRNVLTFEQLQLLNRNKSPKRYQYFGSFISFMDHLIDNEDDALSLAKGDERVMVLNSLGTYKAVADLLNNNLTKYYLETGDCHAALKKSILAHWSWKPRRLLTEYMNTNFGKPWVAVSVIVGLILLVGNVVSIVYGIMGYYK